MIIPMLFLCVQEVLPVRILMLDGQDGMLLKDHVSNCALYRFILMVKWIHP
jgi:hypothetical protein